MTDGDRADEAGRSPTGTGSGSPASDREIDSLRTQLEAERAGARHWRRVARHHEDALADLKGRTGVRALLSLERRTGGLRSGLRRRIRQLRTRLDRGAVAASGWSGRSDLVRRRRGIDELSPVGPETDAADLGSGRTTLLAVVGGSAPDDALLETWMAPGDRASTTVVRLDPADAVTGLEAAVRAHRCSLVAIVGEGAEPVRSGLVSRLGRHVEGTVAVVGPVLIHPERSGPRVTRHDLLVRSAGVDVERTEEGGIRLVSVAAGRDPVSTPSLTDVAALVPGVVVVERRSWIEAGGLQPAGSTDLAVVELCSRIRGRTVVAGDAFAFDHRPVTSPAALVEAVDRRAPDWPRLIGRSGPALARLIAPGGAPLSFSITVASPNAKVARHWGDWHLAEGLAHALARSGHEAVVQSLDRVDSEPSRTRDVQVVLRGLARVERTTGQRHVLWVISHPEDLDPAECDAADLVVVASEAYADHLRTLTTTPVETLLQATDPGRFQPVPPHPDHRHDVTVVGRSRDVLRPMVADALAAGLTPAVYGTGWDGLIAEDLIRAREVPNEDLPVIYSSARVVLNDHWETMRHWGFVSNRIFDVAACATPVISDPMAALHELFDDLVDTWTTPSELASAVARIQADPDRARERAHRLREVVLARHTFDHRAVELLGHLERHDILP